MTSADVIHSFWVPQLNRKIDMIPGRTNEIALQADRAGIYRGQCAEFCGVQHANMGILVVVEPQARFDAWARAQRMLMPQQPGEPAPGAILPLAGSKGG